MTSLRFQDDTPIPITSQQRDDEKSPKTCIGSLERRFKTKSSRITHLPEYISYVFTLRYRELRPATASEKNGQVIATMWNFGRAKLEHRFWNH
jgi:hypothetical protein